MRLCAKHEPEPTVQLLPIPSRACRARLRRLAERAAVARDVAAGELPLARRLHEPFEVGAARVAPRRTLRAEAPRQLQRLGGGRPCELRLFQGAEAKREAACELAVRMRAKWRARLCARRRGQRERRRLVRVE
eukprot:1659538-Pleurochrysis_carterae.AAC.1